MKNIYSIVFLLLISLNIGNSQNGIQYNSEEALKGYTMFETTNKTYLVDNCGYIVNEWSASNTHLHTKMLPDGNMIYIKSGTIYIRDWEDNVVKTITPQNNNIKLVYEVIPTQNNTYLCVAREFFTEEDFDSIGYSFENGTSAYFMDAIVELNDEGETVWYWLLADHVIQERDSLAPNYGILAENPQLLNMDAVATYDWTFEESFMINGFDYNPELDQLALSVRKMSEVVIIDHSTTTEEAASHTGGKYGKGGDILYRWGNPQNYGRGAVEDRVLYFQHNPNWIQYGEHKGKLSIFNNGLSRFVSIGEERYSSATIIDTEVNSDGSYSLEAEQPFGPVEFIEYKNENSGLENFYSGYTSGAKVLPNGNILLTEGDDSRLVELNPAGDKVWEYNVPSSGYMFRGEKYGTDFPGFDGKDMTPSSSTVETFPSTYPCNIFSSVEEPLRGEKTFLISQTSIGIEIVSMSEATFAYQLLDMQGKSLLTGVSNTGSHSINLESFLGGMYVLVIKNLEGQIIQTEKVVR